MKTAYSHFKKICSVILLLVLFAFSSKATTHVITVQNVVFTPNTGLTVNLGDTVKWTWVNGMHTTTSTTIPAGAASWNNPIDVTHQSFIYVPTVTGTYNYQCNFHFTLGMTGSFTVVCSSPSVTIAANGPTTFCSGGSVLLSQSSGGTFTSYQWQKNNSDISGATTSSLTVTAKGTYTLKATNSCGTGTSNGIMVTVNKTPKATVTPAGPLTICPPQTVILTESATSGATYQWQKNDSNISGETNTTLVVSAKGNYSCTVTKKGCSKTSKKVKVTISCRQEDISSPLQSAIEYPNPFSDFTTINTQSMNQPDLINVYDITGKLIASYKVTSDQTQVGQNLHPGIYIARITKDGAVLQTLKLLKSE